MNIQGKRVLVTGAEGFIGSHLVEQLVRSEARVVALVQYNSFNSWGWLEEIPCSSQIEVVAGDIRDAHFCVGLTRGVEAIFHLAALIPIPYSYQAPDSYIETNIRGTLNICQAAVTNGVSKFIATSTSEVYGTAQYVPIDEKHPLQAQSPYSATKIGADAIATSFYCSYGLPVTIARPFNTYGPRQSARAVIPTIISQIAAGAKAIRLGNIQATRDFTYVEDTCRGLLSLAALDHDSADVFNIGSNQEIAVGDLFTLIADIMGSDAQLAIDDGRLRPARSEVNRLRCANEKLFAATGFLPDMPLREGLTRTVSWFTQPSNLKRYKTGVYNV